MTNGTMKKKQLIYAHSQSRYFCAEKVHFSGIYNSKASIGDRWKR